MNSPVLFVDFETRSPVDLKAAGLGRYSRHAATEALMMAWAFDKRNINRWEQGQPIPEPVRKHVEAGGIVVAHNAQFELAIWNSVLARRHGWPVLRPQQVRCTMAAGYAMGLPGGLENMAHALGLAVAKDTEGRALMLKMCKPKREFPDNGTPPKLGEDEVAVTFLGTIYIYHDSPALRRRLGEYCDVDVGVEREAYWRLMPLSDKEQRLWALDQEINLRGVPFDMPSLEAALAMADREKERLDEEMAAATSGAVTACSALPALKAWAADYGVLPDGLAKAEVSELLEMEELPEPVRKALLVRQAAGRFTSISKLKAIKMREIAARVMYLFQYHAATTGRWAGRGVQPHNFPRDLPEPADVETILELIRKGDGRMLDALYGEPGIMISKCLRGFIKSTGGLLMGGDFSSVEGRGLAWLAGEEWKLEAYREIDANPDLPDMYERTYGATFGVAPEAVTKTQRQIGKVEDLAFGYQGGVGAFRTMSKAGNIVVVERLTPRAEARAKKLGMQIFTEAQVNDFKNGWRDANPRIKQYWSDLQDAAVDAVRRPGEITRAGAPGREVMFRKRGSFLWCRLPSGRTLCYPYPVVYTGSYGDFLTYKSVPDATVWAIYSSWRDHPGGKAAGAPNPTSIVDEPGNTREWCRISTYGGKLSENVTQAICRDLLADAMMRVEDAGYQIVLTVHDEIIVEGEFSESDRSHFEKLMCTVPDWAVGFPVNAGCWIAERYRKE